MSISVPSSSFASMLRSFGFPVPALMNPNETPQKENQHQPQHHPTTLTQTYQQTQQTNNDTYDTQPIINDELDILSCSMPKSSFGDSRVSPSSVRRSCGGRILARRSALAPNDQLLSDLQFDSNTPPTACNCTPGRTCSCSLVDQFELELATCAGAHSDIDCSGTGEVPQQHHQNTNKQQHEQTASHEQQQQIQGTGKRRDINIAVDTSPSLHHRSVDPSDGGDATCLMFDMDIPSSPVPPIEPPQSASRQPSYSSGVGSNRSSFSFACGATPMASPLVGAGGLFSTPHMSPNTPTEQQTNGLYSPPYMPSPSIPGRKNSCNLPVALKNALDSPVGPAAHSHSTRSDSAIYRSLRRGSISGLSSRAAHRANSLILTSTSTGVAAAPPASSPTDDAADPTDCASPTSLPPSPCSSVSSYSSNLSHAPSEEASWSLLASLTFPPPPPLPLLKPQESPHFPPQHSTPMIESPRSNAASPSANRSLYQAKGAWPAGSASPSAATVGAGTQSNRGSRRLTQAQQILLNAALAESRGELPHHAYDPSTVVVGGDHPASSGGSPRHGQSRRCWNKSWMVDTQSEPERELAAAQADWKKERKEHALAAAQASVAISPSPNAQSSRTSSNTTGTGPCMSNRMHTRMAPQEEAVFEMDM